MKSLRKELKVSFLSLTILISSLTILISLSLFSSGIVHAAPDTVDSHPTAHTEIGGLVGEVTDPTNAYDENHATYAEYSYAVTGGFEVKSFTIPHFNYSITQVDFKMRYDASGNLKAEYRILYYVDPSLTANVLQAWTSPDSVSWNPRVWSDLPEPNDGTWNWTDINSIRFQVETHFISGGGKGDFEEYEAWVTITGVKPPTTLYVQPPSIVNYTLTPETTKTIRPTADSAYPYTGWTGDHTDWDETVQNGDNDYVNATSTGLMESSQLEDVTPHPDYTIARVRVVAYARTNETTDEQLVLMLVIGGTEYWADYPAWPKPGYNLTTTYEKYTWDWGKNPDTGDYWTWSEIDALEAGVESQVTLDYVWTGEIRVTQLYVEVDGPRFTVDVEVSNVENLWGYTVILGYDTYVLTAASYTTYFPFTSQWPSEINDPEGYVSVTYSKPPLSPGEDTHFPNFNMSLLRIAFLVETYPPRFGRGQTVLDLYITGLTDPPGTPIPHNAVDGYFRNVESERIPVASFTYSPLDPAAGETVTFNASLSTPEGGTIMNYTWDFGDGTPLVTEFDPITTRTYSEPGTYTVTLIVFDDENIVDTVKDDVTVLFHDIAITTVISSPSEVVPGESVSISVTVKNEGNYNETFDVSAFYNSSGAWVPVSPPETVTDLQAGSYYPLDFSWDTTGFALGKYIIYANATVVEYEYDTADNTYIDGTVRIGFRDVAVIDVSVNATEVMIGELVGINVTVENQGDLTQTDLNVTVYYDDTEISSQKNVYLVAGANRTLLFTWDTAGVGADVYTIKAIAETVPGETDTADNTYIDGTVTVTTAVPEFPFGMVMELSVIVAIAYVWWKRRKKTKILKYPI